MSDLHTMLAALTAVAAEAVRQGMIPRRMTEAEEEQRFEAARAILQLTRSRTAPEPPWWRDAADGEAPAPDDDDDDDDGEAWKAGG